MSADNFKAMNNIRTLRALARTLPFELLEEFLEKLTVVVEERRQEVNLEQHQRQERERVLKEYQNMLVKEGFKVEDLLALSHSQKSTRRAKRAKRPAKYRYIDETGEQRTWTGQGRMPTAMNNLIKNQNKTKEDFLITDEPAD